jgi:hypothetical protein
MKNINSNINMTEHASEKAFKKYKKKIIAVMGTKETDNVQISNMGLKLFGKRFIGVCPQDTIPLGKTGMLIANTDLSNEPGSHWVAILSTAKSVYIFDSFGRPAKQLMKILTKNAKAKKIKIINSDLSDKEQRDASSICGPLSLAWLCVVKEMGIRSALLI